MDSGFYSAFTGFSSRIDELDLLANNLANTNTPGYKAQFAFYRSLPAWLQASLTTPLNQVVNQYGVLGGTRLDLTPSNLDKTDNPTDVALQGPGFFVVQTQNGERYTRSGNFRLNAKQLLTTAQGDPVLGDQGPITVPSGQLTISQDGTLSVDGSVVARLKLVDFPAQTPPAPEGNTYFVDPAKAAKPLAEPHVQQGSLETSNSDPVRSAVALIDLQRTSQMMEKALNIFHNDFNRTAVQELPRV